MPPASIILSEKGNNHLFITAFKWIICSDPKEKWLLVSVYHPSSYLQHWSEAAALPGQSTPAESQNPRSGWGHSSSGCRDWCPDSVHAEDSVQGQHCADHCSQGEHCPGLWQVRTPLSRAALGLLWLTPHCAAEQQLRFCPLVFKPPSFALEFGGSLLNQQGTSRLIRAFTPTRSLSCCVTASPPPLTAKPWLQLLGHLRAVTPKHPIPLHKSHSSLSCKNPSSQTQHLNSHSSETLSIPAEKLLESLAEYWNQVLKFILKLTRN